MSQGPLEKIAELDQIEKEIIVCLQSAGQALSELSKEKTSQKTAETQTQTFLKSLNFVESKLSEQINYLTQVSTGQPHEGSGYAAAKVLQMAWHRNGHVKSRVRELEECKSKYMYIIAVWFTRADVNKQAVDKMSAPKVSEIFKAAGEAFNRLGELTMQLQNRTDNNYSKWGEEDIDMLQSAITTFGEDLNKISVRVKNRTASQIRQTLTKQVFEEAGIRVQQVNVQQSPNNGGGGSHLNAQTGVPTVAAAAVIQAAGGANNGTPQQVVIQQSPGVVVKSEPDAEVQEQQHLIHQQPSPTSSEVMMTLNRLNAHEMDTEDQLKLEFDVETEVATG